MIDHGNKLPSPDSGWIDFAIFTKPGPDGSGHIEIVANGKPIVTVKGQIGHADKGLGKNQYFKFGPYRAAHANVNGRFTTTTSAVRPIAATCLATSHARRPDPAPRHRFFIGAADLLHELPRAA